MAKTLADISEAMRDIDFCTLTTPTAGGAIGARPMSNNRNTPGMVMVAIKAQRLPYWDGEEEGEVRVG